MYFAADAPRIIVTGTRHISRTADCRRAPVGWPASAARITRTQATSCRRPRARCTARRVRGRSPSASAGKSFTLIAAARGQRRSGADTAKFLDMFSGFALCTANPGRKGRCRVACCARRRQILYAFLGSEGSCCVLAFTGRVKDAAFVRLGTQRARTWQKLLARVFWLVRCFRCCGFGRKGASTLSDHYISPSTGRVYAGVYVDLHIRIAVKEGTSVLGVGSCSVLSCEGVADEVTSCTVSLHQSASQSASQPAINAYGPFSDGPSG